MARVSYFAEMRTVKHNPSFYLNIKQEELDKNVKRIIRDIKYDNIEEQDYKYFQCESILNSCIRVAMQQNGLALATHRALTDYREKLNSSRTCFNNDAINTEMTYVDKKVMEYENKSSVWHTIYWCFYSIKYCNAGIHTTLYNIKTLNFDPGQDL